jgi:hypothetical protein
MKNQQVEYAEEHRREMVALVLMVDAMQQGNQDEALAWARRMGSATDAKMRLLAQGINVEDADIARALAESSFEREHPGRYQAARGFMYALKARMGR